MTTPWYQSWTALSLGLLACAACAATRTPSSQDEPATLELKRLVAGNPDVKRLLIASIEQAKKVNPDPNTNPAQSLEQYYGFVSWAERAIPWRLLEQRPSGTLYQRIEQSLCYLYFICDQRLTELEGRGYLENSLQYVEPFNAWLKAFVRSWGAFLDTPASWNEAYLRLARADETFGLRRGWYEDPSHWSTFNQFFARRLESADQRPIAAPDDESVVASPVDGVLQGVWSIDGNSCVIEESGIPVKTGTVHSVEQLIGGQSRYKSAFAGGTFMHLFLDVNDYHRYHFPLGGVVREVAILPGQELSGGSVTWDPDDGRYKFDPSAVGYQALETRGCVILETEGFGLVALLPIGMSPVSSVNLEPGLKEGVRVRKGDELGHFLFGGSDFVIVFQAGCEFTPDSPRLGSGRTYAHVLMGERLGRLRRISESAHRGPTVEEALHAYTAANAYAGFHEDDLGTIEAGKLADLVVLSADPFAIDPRNLATIRVLRTVVGGVTCYTTR